MEVLPNNSQRASTGGWANVGLDLSSYEGEYVRLEVRFREGTMFPHPPVSPELQGWYIDALESSIHYHNQGGDFPYFFKQFNIGDKFPNGFGFLNLDATVRAMVR